MVEQPQLQQEQTGTLHQMKHCVLVGTHKNQASDVSNWAHTICLTFVCA